MKKIFNFVRPIALTIAVAASLGYVNADAAQTNANAMPVTTATFQAAMTPHSLTRRDVFNQLVKAEKDGSFERLNSTLYAGG